MIRVLWKPLLYACSLPLAIYLPIILVGNNIGEPVYWLLLLLIFFGAPWTVVWTNGWRTGLIVFAAAAVSVLISLLLLLKSYDVRTAIRWTFNSGTYKRQVLEQRNSSSGLQHIDWDGWGWGGQDTFAYLVYDPQNHLASGVEDSTGVKAEGLPCEVSQIHRLENHWYTVVFYTDAQWNSC